MRHARPDYDRMQDPAGLIPVEEPVFLIRGQDINAPLVVRYWADCAEANGSPANIVEAARRQAVAMQDWQVFHKQKRPDMP